MGGHRHKGQAQRTKNNAKPANSGRIAELVNKGHNFPSFSGSINENPFSPPPQAPVTNLALDVLSPNVDPNFQVVLKKMNKKDATTRFKALQELKELCKESNPKVIEEVLPVWCRIYTLLAVDVEHRVREAVQDVNRLIVTSVGRSLAPHLRTIAPLWFLSQYDTYAPAAYVATTAFQEAFPPHKVAEVIAFCQTEILQYIHENLLNLTPQALSKGDLSKEEMEQKYERIIICCLNGLSLYLSKVSPENIKKFENLHREIISSPKFWKFAKYKTPGVRSAWFSLLSSICQHASFLLENEKKHVANSVIASIDDYDSSVLSIVWEAALRSFTTLKDFWEFVNMDKFFLPKFCHMLKGGGQGNASCIYPNVILVINSIPTSVIKDKASFYTKIFDSFREGMKQPIVDQSFSESDAVVKSFIECIQFLILKNIESAEFCNLILEQLFKVISTTIVESSTRKQLKPIPKALYSNLPQMLFHWYKNEDNEVYASLLQLFWSKVSNNFIEILRKSLVDKEQLSACLNSQILILDILRPPFKILYVKSLKVSFVDEILKEVDDEPFPETWTPVEKKPCETKFEDAVMMLAGELLVEYHTLALNEDYKQYRIQFIIQIMSLLNITREELFETLSTLQPNWASSLELWILNKELPVNYILCLLFETFSTLSLESQAQLITQLTKVRCKESLLEGLKLASQRDYPHLQKWLHSDEIKNEINHLYDIANKSRESFDSDFFDYVFLVDRSGEFVVGTDTILSLVEKIEGQLLSRNEFDLEFGSKAVLALIEGLNMTENIIHQDTLLRLLEPLFLHIVLGKGRTVFKTWLKGIHLIERSKDGTKYLKQHFDKICNLLGTYINATETVFDVRLIHQAVTCLLSLIVDDDSDKMKTLGIPCMALLLSTVFSTAVKESLEKIEEVCLIAEMTNGIWSYDALLSREFNFGKETEGWKPLHGVNTVGFANTLLFSIKIISSGLGLYLDTDYLDERGEDDEDSEFINYIVDFPEADSGILYPYIIEHLTFGLALLQILQKYYKSTKECLEIADLMKPLERYITDLVQMIEGEPLNELLAKFLEKDEVSNFKKNKVSVLINKFTDMDSQVEERSMKVKNSFMEEKLLDSVRFLTSMISRKLLNQEDVIFILTRLCNLFRPPETQKDLSTESKESLVKVGELARLFEAAIISYPKDLTQQIWDAVRLHLVTWLQRISVTHTLHTEYIEFVGMVNGVCALLISLVKVLRNEPNLDDYFEEWKEVFAADVFYHMCMSWKIIIEHCQTMGVDHVRFLHINTLCEAISFYCDCQFEIKTDVITIQESVDFMLIAILMPSATVQITSFKVLSLLLPYMMALDENLDESSLEKISCSMLEQKLLETQTVVLAMLQDYGVGISCSVEPFTDSYTYSLGYLLLWSLLIQYCYRCQDQQKYLYPLWIREKNIISHFIEATVKIMPENVLYFHESNNKRGQELFTVSPIPYLRGYGDAWTSNKLSHLSCWLLTELLGHLPAIVRQWASEADPKQLSFVDGITTAFISPYLCSREMDAIRKQQKSFDNMKVVTHPSVGEVIAVYSVEESSTELIIQLSNNYPLTPPKVDISKAMVSSIQTRQWLKQLTIFLTHQNGSIWDGLILWKSNLDKKFEGVEECYICFSILHNTTHQLPKLSCHTCKKKFHSYCLYKWFSTSNKSTCPICRAIF